KAKNLTMKKPLLLSFLVITCYTASAQFVAKMEIKEPISGLCKQEVYALITGLKGQIPAECSLTKAQMNEKLNEIQFLKDHPGYNNKGMMGLIINCKGQVVQCKMDNKTKSPELDSQIEKVFDSFPERKAGKLKKKNVDTSKLFSIKIENGMIMIN